ncbi:MAG: lysophospholipid acyltransferase family protein [Verrucomicrobiia bacterium]
MSLTNRIQVVGGAAGSRGLDTTTIVNRRSVRSEGAVAVPGISRPLLRWFTWYSRRYLRRHFHALRISLSGKPPASKLPLVIYLNHASWWDPLLGLVLKSEFFADRTLFAPMDAAMLERYPMFARLGFFGVEPHSRRGAVQFLRAAEAILRSPQHLLAVTPQSRFADVRERPVCFEAGLGHLATRVEGAFFVPCVAEYVYWEERLPEILVRFGEPVEVRREHASAFAPDFWTKQFEQKLEAVQDALSIESRRRDPALFQTLLRGGAGQGGIYDWWRATRAKLRGEEFKREHGRK